MQAEVKFMNKLYAYLPCYNEAGNIEKLVNGWLEIRERLIDKGYELSVIPIDDKSTDNTLSIICKLRAEHKEVRIISHVQNQNLGGVLSTAINDFLKLSSKDDLMCFMDGDNTHKPCFVLDMVDAIRNADCVIASRYQKGSVINGVPHYRLLLSECARFFYSAILHVPHVRDYTCGYRLYRREAILNGQKKYEGGLVSNKTFSCMIEMLYKLHLCGCKFAEVPFTLHYDDKMGSSKMNILKTITDSIFLTLRLRFSI